MPRIPWNAAYGVMLREGPRGLQVLLGRREGGRLHDQYDLVGTKLRQDLITQKRLLHIVRERMARAFTAKTGIKVDYAEPLPEIVRENGKFRCKPWFMFGPRLKKKIKTPSGYGEADWHDVSSIASRGTADRQKWFIEVKAGNKTAKHELAEGVGETIRHAQTLHRNYMYYVGEVLEEAANVNEESWAKAVENSGGKLNHPIYWTSAILVDKNWNELARGYRTQKVTEAEHGPGDDSYETEHWKNHAEETALEVYRRQARRRGINDAQIKEELIGARMIMVTKPCHERSLGTGRISCAEHLKRSGISGFLFVSDDLNRKIKDRHVKDQHSRKSPGVMHSLRNGLFVNSLHQSSPETYIALIRNRQFHRHINL